MRVYVKALYYYGTENHKTSRVINFKTERRVSSCRPELNDEMRQITQVQE